MIHLRRVALLAAAISISHVSRATERLPRDAVTIAVSPAGDDSASGDAAHPFRTIERAQQAVRSVDRDRDVVVMIDGGVYRISHTLVFTAADGGHKDHRVIWTAKPGAHPVFSSGLRVQGWHVWDAKRGIYVAEVPKGIASREVWLNGQLAPMASIEITRNDYTFTREGMRLKPSAASLPDVSHEPHLELRATGFFTERISPIKAVEHGNLIMRQPAWDNNLWGYDTIEKPFHPELQHLYLANALALISKPGQWYLDADAGKLYIKPSEGVDIAQADVELPRLAVLMSISGTLDESVKDLEFSGIRFSYTSWLGPSSDEGYASQQSGSYLAGVAPAYPADPIATCAQGCPAFESMRNEWRQMPASVQVSAAERVTFDHNIFAHLGQYALGIGNDADAMASRVGLGASDVVVNANLFTDCGGGAILAGGVQRDAHHPRDPRQTNQGLVIRDNRIHSVSEEYRDNSAILSTYVSGAVIVHNDISDVPYDAIDIGYGWGIQDPGGNANYRVRMRGYQWPQNLVYQTPTTHRDVVIAGNRIHDAKKLFHDGGAIYNLSASPGTLITENYIFDNHGMIGLYLDEGSRYITVRKNVVQDPNSEWLNINTVHAALPLRISPDNTAVGNWHDGTKVGGLWTNYENDLILDDHPVTDGRWPAEAQEIIKSAGIEPGANPPENADEWQNREAAR